MIKRYHSEKYRQKFQRYRIFFLFSAILFFGGLIFEILLYGSAGFHLFPGKITLSEFFLPLLCAEGILYLLIFFFGLTLYAPFFGFFFSFSRGVLSGFCMASSYGGIGEKGGVILFFLTVLYILSSAWLFLGYSTFCTTAALHIYSPSEEKKKEGKMKQFGGSLFRSGYFCGRINLRFLSTYCLLFLVALLFAAVLTFFYAYLRISFGI